MRTLLVEESTSAGLSGERPGFFERQVAPEVTRAQNIFDWVFGVVGPALCFYFDPIVFKGGMFGAGGPMLPEFQVVAYAISVLQIPVLGVWLLFGRQLRSFSAPIGGFLVAGALFSFLVGASIFPYSVLGLIFLIGIFGFTPFITAYVYLRNGRRAINTQERNSAYSSRVLTAALAGVLAIALPVSVNQLINKTTSRFTQAIISGDATQVDLAVNQMRWLPFIPEESLQKIVFAYQKSRDPERRQLLKESYRELAGEDIDARIQILND